MRKYVSKALLSLGASFCLMALGTSLVSCTSGVRAKSGPKKIVKTEDQETKLLEILTRSQNLAAELRLLVTEDDSVDNPFEGLAAKLDETRIRILNLIQSRGYAVHDPMVLAQVDYLILLISDGGDLKLERRLDDLEEEARKKFEELANNLRQLKEDLKNFEEQVNTRFNAIESDIEGLKARDQELAALIKEVETSSNAANLALRASLKELQDYTQKEIAELYKVSSELKKKLEEQYKNFNELLAAQGEVDNLQAKMCSVDGNGNINDSRGACTGSEPDILAASCCLTLDQVQCGTLFPSEIQLPARNQCNIIIATLKNHQAQLAAIREVDAKQSELIKGILEEIDDLRKQDEILAKGIEIITETIGAVVAKIEQIDNDLVIIKFKLARSEAAASLRERADLYLAWVTRRSSDVHERFCRKNINAALNS
ncbi:MAG: hypothetical protein KDD43_11465, partial [Bdellovibrionales bacterium]|nr:hypothetical protein [Bdellovibrionales bacterium]